MPRISVNAIWTLSCGLLLASCPAPEPDRTPGACVQGQPADEAEGVCTWVGGGRCYSTAAEACRCICPADRECLSKEGTNEMVCDWDSGVGGPH